MELQDVLSVGLTPEDFDLMLEGIDAIPEKGMAGEMMHSMMGVLASAGMSEKGREDMKRKALAGFRDFEKKAASKKDDLIILKSKIVLLKRLLLTQSSVSAANDILNKR